MSVFKNKKRVNPYSQIDNAMINDRRLPLECIGLMTYLLSKPEDWTISMQQLQSHFDIGREKMQRLTKILESAGYLIRMKPQNEQGQFIGTYWHVTDEPTTGNTDYRKTRQSENPTVEKAVSQYTNKENSTNKEYSNNKEKEKETSAFAQSVSVSENDNSVVKNNFTSDIEEKKEKKEPSIGRGAVTTEMPKVLQVVEYMNRIAGTKYRANTGNTAKMILARYKDGYTMDEMKIVISTQYAKWKGTDMMQHFNPVTLFRPNNFEKYLNSVNFGAAKQTAAQINGGSDYTNWDESKKPF